MAFFGGFQGTCRFHAKNSTTGCKKWSPVLGGSVQHKKEALLRLHDWLLSYNEYDRQYKHVERDLRADVSGMDPVETRRALKSVVAPTHRPLTDIERDEGDGIEHVARRARVKRVRRQ